MIFFTRLKHRGLEKNLTNLHIAFSSQKSIVNTHFLRLVKAYAVIWHKFAFSLQHKPTKLECHDKLL